MIDWTKDTHCPYCEKELPNESQCDEADEIQAQFGLLSQQARTYIALFCWDYPELVCATYQREDELEEDVADRRVRQLLTERDMLRAALTIYGERQNWHYERWPSEYVHPNEVNLYTWVGDGFRAPWQLANKVLEKDGDA